MVVIKIVENDCLFVCNCEDQPGQTVLPEFRMGVDQQFHFPISTWQKATLSYIIAALPSLVLLFLLFWVHSFFSAHLLPAITISAWTTVAWHFSHFLYAQMALNVEHKTRQRLSDRLHVELSGNMALTVWDWGVWCALRERFNVF